MVARLIEMNKRHSRGLISVISAVLIICTASFTGIDAKAATQVMH